MPNDNKGLQRQSVAGEYTHMTMQLCASEAATPPAGAHSRARAVLSTLEIHQHTTLGTLPLHCGWLLLHAAAAQAWTLGPRRPVQVHTASGARGGAEGS